MPSFLRFRVPNLRARRSPPDVPSPTHQPLNRASGRHGWADVEVEYGFARGFGWAGVIVDNVAYLFLPTVEVARDIPIVTIERRISPEKITVSTQGSINPIVLSGIKCRSYSPKSLRVQPA